MRRTARKVCQVGRRASWCIAAGDEVLGLRFSLRWLMVLVVFFGKIVGGRFVVWREWVEVAQ
jgi:hypothetical protein